MSMFTLCVFSLPFVFHGSSMEMPKRVENHRYTRSETGHLEIDALLQKVVRQNSTSNLILFSTRIDTSLSTSILQLSDRIETIRILMH